MKLVLLGTGTPAPSRRRMGAGHLVDLGRAVIVFDHGPGAHQRLIEAGYRAQDVTHLFLTHHHYDHILDVPRLILTRWPFASMAAGRPCCFHRFRTGPPAIVAETWPRLPRHLSVA